VVILTLSLLHEPITIKERDLKSITVRCETLLQFFSINRDFYRGAAKVLFIYDLITCIRQMQCSKIKCRFIRFLPLFISPSLFLSLISN